MTSDEEVRARLAGLPSVGIPADVRRAVLDRLAQESQVAEVVHLTPRHQRRLSGLLVAAAVAAFVMLISVAGGSPSTPTPTAQPIVKAGAIYDPGQFDAQLRSRFMGAPATDEPTNTFADSASALGACTESIDAYGTVLVLDVGLYAGGSAVVIVSNYPGDSEYEEVWVVSPDCGSTDSHVIRHFLLDVDNSTATL